MPAIAILFLLSSVYIIIWKICIIKYIDCPKQKKKQKLKVCLKIRFKASSQHQKRGFQKKTLAVCMYAYVFNLFIYLFGNILH